MGYRDVGTESEQSLDRRVWRDSLVRRVTFLLHRTQGFNFLDGLFAAEGVSCSYRSSEASESQSD